jgi:protein arginine kinase activator
MLCMLCKQNPAKVHLTQIVEDKVQKVDLCDDCAKQKGVNNDASFSLADLLLGLGASQEIAPTSSGVEIRCPGCGFTQADFKKAGRLGCAQCYTTFSEGLESLLKSMHKGTKHVGKVPSALRQGRDMVERLKNLQKKLDRAVTAEDFEQAASLRDEIKSAKDQMERPASQVTP